MTSTVSRPTPSLAVPSTQNTAPVLDFRCLYTYDLRRKAKRWQDGLARFHTFNRRVMVYDEPRNFIGDTHWREPEPIQDGDELQLDKGILIQIGEATGKTDQDISGLFEKRKAALVEDTTSPTRTGPLEEPGLSKVKVTQAAASQLRPRTLNSLLGTPKGQLGRAALPTKSPFELRNVSEVENEVEERAAKRQRVSYPIVEKTPSSPASRPHPPKNKAMPDIQQVSEDLAVIEPTKPKKTALLSKRTSPKKPSNTAAVSRPQSETSKHGALKPNGPASERNLAPAMKKAPSTKRNQSEVVTVNSSRPEQEKVVQGARLRIVSRKPRKKLMYRDLIPQARQAPQDFPEDPKRVTNRKTKNKPTSPDIDPLSQFHHEEQDRLEARLLRHDRRRAPNEQNLDDPEIVETETLFLSQNENACCPIVISDDKEPTASPVQRNHSPRNRHRHSDAKTADDLEMLFSEEQFQPPEDDSAYELAKMDAVLLRRPQQPLQTISDPELINPHQPPVRKSCIPPKVSSPPPYPNPTIHSPPKQIDPNPLPPPAPRVSVSLPLQRSLSAIISATTTAQQPRRSLRKTVSDTGALRPGAAVALPLPPVSVEAAPDPWSSEAWDLFGWRRRDYVEKDKEKGRKDAGG